MGVLMGQLHTPEARAKAKIGREERSARIAKYGWPPPLKAIRQKCLDCSGEGESWVRQCELTKCPLWPYRMGRKPKEKDLMVAEISRQGEVAGWHHLDEHDKTGA